MFDSVISRSRGPQSNAAGLGLAICLCVLFALAAAHLFSPGQADDDKDVDITLFTAPPPPPPPPPPPASSGPSQPVEKKPVVRKKDTVVQPKVETEEQPKPSETPPPTETPDPAGVPGGVPGGVAGGVVGGVPGGVVGGVPGGTGTRAIPFGVGMTRPQPLGCGEPQYTASARAARVEGKVLVRCTITVTGQATDCKVIKSVPFLDQIVLDFLRSCRFSPVTFQGRPEMVQYLLTYNFKLY